ncbi:MAG: hypothetical protein M3Y66_08200 [Actinomycetota bacterium]|nr:hypothetical protein [Actinomycetota bacterium]
MTGRLSRGVGWLLAAAAVLILAPAAVAFAGSATPNLTGEALALDVTRSFSGCDPAAASYVFAMSGNATGSYPGTYDATATNSVVASQRLTRISFTIHNARGVVTGVQTLSAPADAQGACAGFSDAETLAYTATIGPVTDHGTSTLTVLDKPAKFLDTFSAAPEPTSSPAPTATPSQSPTAQPTDTPTTTSGPTAPPAPSTPPADLATFRYRVRQTVAGPVGDCSVKGGTTAAPVTITCVDVMRYRRHGHQVTFSGHATVNGVPTTYRIDVADLAEPGTGHDVFLIKTGTGYLAGGKLDSGNLIVQ